MKIRPVVVGAVATAAVALATAPASASSIHTIPSSVVTTEASTGHGCEAWLQWKGSKSNPSVRLRGESWGNHCLVSLYLKGHQYHSWHFVYAGDVGDDVSNGRQFWGYRWISDGSGYKARACVVGDIDTKVHCGKPW